MPFDGVGFVTNDPLAKIDAVIDLLATPERWCKGALRSPDGRYCIRGALRAADAAELLEPTILRAIGEVSRTRYRRIESFNDHPNTTHDQVVAALRRAREHIAGGMLVAAANPLAPPPAWRLAAWRGALRGWLAG